MLNMKSVALALGATTLLWGCAQPQPSEPAIDLAAEAQAVKDRSAEWLALAQARDAAGIAALYMADGVTLFDGELRHGVAEIQAAMEADFAANAASTVSWTTHHVHVAASADLAYELGSFTYDVDGEGEAAPVSGEYVTVWVKSDGAWRAAADAGTVAKPAEAAEGESA